MNKSAIIDWYCKDQEHPGCESCKYEGHNRRSECLPVQRLSAMLDELIQSAPDEIKAPYVEILTWNDHCVRVKDWKHEVSK